MQVNRCKLSDMQCCIGIPTKTKYEDHLEMEGVQRTYHKSTKQGDNVSQTNIIFSRQAFSHQQVI